ncbi:MAG: single-stranded DNA-binding protein, partial [Bacteroidales bacterium]|nr:single-stranded DNA-binding protein [Bacteroidales bacterium]
MQTILISGNLAKDCEVIQGKEGAEMLRFDVAVNDGRDKDEKPTYYTC